MSRTRPDGSRSIRSYIRRQGRLTRAQARALGELWDEYGLEIESAPTDVARVFARDAPLVVEVGFGMGHALVAMAEQHPEWNFIGVDVYRPGVGALLLALARKQLHNVRAYESDAMDVLERALTPGTISILMVYFPDPWPKKRHHKRRLVRRPFLDLAATRLHVGGRILIATDWEPYAAEMLEALEDHPSFANAAAGHGFAPRPVERPVTRFESRGVELGHQVYDLVFERVR
jgi:tRNA (guanine-N7-)-methyltransferase